MWHAKYTQKSGFASYLSPVELGLLIKKRSTAGETRQLKYFPALIRWTFYSVSWNLFRHWANLNQYGRKAKIQ